MTSYDEHLISQAGGDGDALDLDAIQARADAATEGPWRLYDGKRDNRDAAVETAWAYDGDDAELITDWCHPADANFIAHARTDVPALLALVREQAIQLEGLRTDMQDAMADAWDEGYTTGNAHNGRRDANPYRAAAVRGEG